MAVIPVIRRGVFSVRLGPGWHNLVLLTANREFGRYFHCRILDAATGKVPADLQIALEPVTRVNPAFAE